MTEELHHERDATISFEQTNSMDHGTSIDRACCRLQCVRFGSSYVLDGSNGTFDSSNLCALHSTDFCARNIGPPGPGRPDVAGAEVGAVEGAKVAAVEGAVAAVEDVAAAEA